MPSKKLRFDKVELKDKGELRVVKETVEKKMNDAMTMPA